MTDDTLSIRPARPEDREAVVAMVATVWGGTDYVPEVWDEWLADESGPLLVGELGGQPVALAKLTSLGEGEDWFEGLRIAPEQRGRGLARAMVRYCTELSRERGMRVLRFTSNIRNPTMHRLADDLGFRLCYIAPWYNTTALPNEPTTDEEHSSPEAQPNTQHATLQTLAEDRLGDLLADLERSALLRVTGGLYSHGWTAYDLTEARLRAHLERGEVHALKGGAAWAIVPPSDWGGFWIAHAHGAPGELARLLLALRRAPEPKEGTYLRAHLPQEPTLAAALEAAGYTIGEHGAHFYEWKF
ncbi:MAG TPA: GNAT family N-acetyltransferase [Roseiflexaceae bacterium]|nr:GNAT family N-acetyltransferase [Roseiflexaceae bacterium]